MEAILEIDGEVLATAEQVASQRGQTLSAFVEQALRAAFEGLTSRELEILKLVCQGLDNQQIADRLSLSRSTVRNYVERILTKLHANTRGEAVSLLQPRRSTKRKGGDLPTFRGQGLRPGVNLDNS